VHTRTKAFWNETGETRGRKGSAYNKRRGGGAKKGTTRKRGHQGEVHQTVQLEHNSRDVEVG